jgi:pimeloyl-ACP methyl ester carboxylesterase
MRAHLCRASLAEKTKEIEMSQTDTKPAVIAGTIVLVHGLWMTPRSWEHWIERYTARGYRVIAPAYPGLDVEVEALNADPAPIERLTVPAVLESFEGVIRELDGRPILMGHSFGGLIVQILLDRGFGAAGIAIDSGAPEGVRTLPLTQARAGFPVLKNPANRHRAVAFTRKEFHYAFANTLSEEQSDAVYDRYHVPAPGGFVWDGVLANFTPGHHDTYVDFKNNDRSPLLLIGGGQDHLEPLALNRANFDHYKHSNAVTELEVFPDRAHYTLGQDGWEEVADYALSWALGHARVGA